MVSFPAIYLSFALDVCSRRILENRSSVTVLPKTIWSKRRYLRYCESAFAN